jgi:NAD(P)-dependent dehydrogenase (short-subunit alcohol dehydrogenase family)
VLDRHDRLDILVNNASVITLRHQLTADGLETTFATNHMGPFLLTNLLRGLLERSAPARVVTVSSGAHKQVRAIPWDDLPHGLPDRHRTYPVTKLLNILFTVELAGRLAGTGVTANCLHPGFVRTDLGRDITGAFGMLLRLVRPFQASPATGAETSVYLASSPEVAQTTGRYFVKCRPTEPSALARDRAAAARLWALSEQLSGLESSSCGTC